jgi:hypothetical protein
MTYETVQSRPSVEELRRLFSYDPITGLLYWAVNKGKRARAGDIAGSSHRNGRTCHVGIDGVSYMVHTVIWAMWYGVWPEQDIDHEDHDGLNNRIGNLRESTDHQNLGNKRSTLGGTSQLKGVSRHRSWHLNYKWQSRITFNNHELYIGSFISERDAGLAYDAAAKIVYGEFACLNFPAVESEHVILPERVLRRLVEPTTIETPVEQNV